MDGVVEKIRAFLQSELRVPEELLADPEVPLVRRGAIDSMDLMRVVQFLEGEFGMQVETAEMLPSNLGSVHAIAGFVQRKSSSSEGG